MEAAFRSSYVEFFKESFILASGNGFSINYKLCAFIRSFFQLVDTMLEIRCKSIFFNFFLFLTAEAVFPASGNECFLSSASFRRVETDFLLSPLLLRANIVLVETIIQIKVDPLFIE